MKRIVSKKFKERGIIKEQIIPDDAWVSLIKSGMSEKYECYDIPNRPLKEVPSVTPEKPVEIKKKPQKIK